MCPLLYILLEIYEEKMEGKYFWQVKFATPVRRVRPPAHEVFFDINHSLCCAQWLPVTSRRIHRPYYLNSQCNKTLPRPNQQISWAFRPIPKLQRHGPKIALFQAPPFKEFQKVLAFISSLGLATAASCAFSLVGITSSFSDSGDAAKAQIKNSGLFLSWASACFIVSIGFVAATQLLYTEPVIIHVLGKKETSPEKVIIRVGLACFAWIALGFQTAAMVLLGQSLKVFARGPVYLANFGLVASAVLVVIVMFVGMTSERKGRKKLSILWTLGGLVPWLGTLFGKRIFVVSWLDGNCNAVFADSKKARSSGGTSVAAHG